jgi:hypothetical protein
MKLWPWGLLSGASALLTGCEQSVRAPLPPIDAAVPAIVETATFALG